MNHDDTTAPAALAKLAARKKELTGAYNLIVLLFAVIFVGALGLGSVVGPVGPAAEQTDAPAQTDVDHSDMDMDGGAN